MLKIKYLGPNMGFELYDRPLMNETAPYVEIECGTMSCRVENKEVLFDEACQYLKQYTNGQKVIPNIVSEISTEASSNGIVYIKKVVLPLLSH